MLRHTQEDRIAWLCVRVHSCACVRERARTYAFVWGLFCFYVLVRTSNLIAVQLLQQDENQKCACFRGREGDTEREGEQVREGERERFWISCYVTFSCQGKQKPR